MAKLIKNYDVMSFGKSFSRLNGQPLDKSEVWYNYQDLVDYAKTDAAYVGQKVFYVEMNEDGVTGTVNHYSIEVDGSLKSLGQQEINITVTDDEADAIGIGKYVADLYNIQVTNWE